MSDCSGCKSDAGEHVSAKASEQRYVKMEEVRLVYARTFYLLLCDMFNSAIPFFWQPPSSAPAFPASFAGPAPASSALPSPHARFPAVPDAAA